MNKDTLSVGESLLQDLECVCMCVCVKGAELQGTHCIV
jgi:hypothetical protein